VGDAFNAHDSFNGWGAFIGPPRVSNNLICWTYQQHSHNQNRNVWFSAHYRPPKDVKDTVYYILQPLIVPAQAKGELLRPMRTELVSFNQPHLLLVQQPLQQALQEISRSISQLQIVGSTALSNASANVPPPNGSKDPVPNPNYYAPSGDTGPVARPLEYGLTYFAPYHLGVNYELVVQAFTGDMIYVTTSGGGGHSSQIDAAPENGERLKIRTNAPW
jgi:hypothetical protein